MKVRYLVIASVLAVGSAQQAFAGDAAAGEQAYAAKACIGCHGPAGKSPNPDMYPKLAGKDEAYISEQLNAFRKGTRNNPLMTPMSTTLTDEDVANIAAYIGSLK